MEVRCCCTPDNLIGDVPVHAGLRAGLQVRQMQDNSWAFSSEGQSADRIRDIPGFEAPAEGRDRGKKGGKSWKPGK